MSWAVAPRAICSFMVSSIDSKIAAKENLEQMILFYQIAPRSSAGRTTDAGHRNG